MAGVSFSEAIAAGTSEWVEGVPNQESDLWGGGVHPHLVGAERKTFYIKLVILMWILFSSSFW